MGTKYWSLIGEKLQFFRNKMIKEGIWMKKLTSCWTILYPLCTRKWEKKKKKAILEYTENELLSIKKLMVNKQVKARNVQ